MPSLPPRRRPRANPLRLMVRRQVALGMTATFLFFMGQFALFTYLRPYLEGVADFSVAALSLAFLGLGLAGLAGVWTISRALHHWLFALLAGIPALMAVLALLMVALPSQAGLVMVLILLWGFLGTAAPVGWGTWVARTLGDEAEAGGGLQVAVIQLAIMAGAAGGGFILDALDWRATFTLGALLLLASALMALLAAYDNRRTK